MTQIAGSTHDFAQYLLQSFVILESNLDAMIEKYNYLATRQELLQKKLKLVNEKLGAVLFAQQQHDKDNIGPEATSDNDLLSVALGPDGDDCDGSDGVGREIKLVPKMNKNPAQIHQQLTLLKNHIDQMDQEMISFKKGQDQLMMKQCQMFGIGMTVESVGKKNGQQQRPGQQNMNKNGQIVNSTHSQFAPIRCEFQSLLGDIVDMYNTLLSYRVRIQAAQNELEEKSWEIPFYTTPLTSQ